MAEAASGEDIKVRGYHAHVYYDPGTRARAEKLREALAARFAVRLGRWHDRLIGPHPRSSYQVAFAPELFGEVVPFLALHRAGLTVLVHTETGDDIADHTEHALWMGEVLALDLGRL